MRRLVPSSALLAALAVLAGCAVSATHNEARVRVTDNGFEPAIVMLPHGPNATLVITRVSDATCATEAVFAESGRKYPLPLNQDVRIPLDAARPETLHYACGMDMYKGRVVVQ